MNVKKIFFVKRVRKRGKLNIVLQVLLFALFFHLLFPSFLWLVSIAIFVLQCIVLGMHLDAQKETIDIINSIDKKATTPPQASGV